MAPVRFLELVHPREYDAFVVPGDSVFRPQVDCLVVALEGLAQPAFLEVHRPEIAPGDLVLRIQADRVLMATERIVDSSQGLHRDAAGRPRIRRTTTHADRPIAVQGCRLRTPLLPQPGPL